MARSTFNANANYYIDVDAALQSQNFAGNYSIVYWRVLVVKTYGYGFMATTNMGNSGWADSNVGGNPDLWQNNNLAYDFRNGSMTGTFTMAEGTFRVNHRADGTAEYFVNGALQLYNLGYARADTGIRGLPKFNRTTVPPAPKPIGTKDIAQTSAVHQFSGTGNGGAPILEWQIGFGTSTTTPQHYRTSSGTTALYGLAPGTTYYVWSRGRNVNGWGPWSARTSFRSIAGARVKVGGVWKEAVPYVRVNGEWKIARPYARIGGNWRESI